MTNSDFAKRIAFILSSTSTMLTSSLSGSIADYSFLPSINNISKKSLQNDFLFRYEIDTNQYGIQTDIPMDIPITSEINLQFSEPEPLKFTI